MIDKMKVARHLAEKGFNPRIAGEADFNMAVETVSLAMETNRGIFVFGPCGVGKSLICRIAAPILLKPDFKSFIMGDPVRGTQSMSNADWLNAAITNGAYVDDLGAEEDMRVYGERHNAVAEFVYAMHWHFEAYPTSGKIVSNTNLSLGDFVKRYGERVFSRLRSMTVFWSMTGDDKRSYAKVNSEGVFIRDEIQKTKAVNYAKEVMA